MVRIWNANTLIKGPNTNEMMTKYANGNKDLIYYIIDKDSNVSTVTENVITSSNIGSHYMFNDPYLMIFYESDTPGTYTTKYLIKRKSH